ncbi:MAG: hydroxymethylglutaryl-CoA lyase [Bacteroidia bacterium]
MIKLIECPRDAMQGITEFISTSQKASYINKLLQVGFDTIDFGSFVSPKAIPQMRDTAEVLQMLNLGSTNTKLLAIIANIRGAEQAVTYNEITYLGFPFSISETFQQRNTNTSILQSFYNVQEIQNLCLKQNKKLVIYISMGFGNPYGDPWNAEIAIEWVEKMAEIGIEIISLSDTIGIGNQENIGYLFSHLVKALPNIEFGAHLHTTPETWFEKVEAAYQNGCKRFDGALKGFGGCPMATDKLTGNMPMENLVSYFNQKNLLSGLNQDILKECLEMANEIFN